VKFALPFAYAALIAASGGPVLAAGPPGALRNIAIHDDTFSAED
jgi:hypothetical protein